MRCEQSERWISLGADQELSVQEVGLLREHLSQCSACQILADETRDMGRWFVASPEVSIPAGFAARVVSAAFDGQDQTAKGPRGLVAGGVHATPSDAGTGRMQGFLLQITALAALLLAALAFALAGKQASESNDLFADRTSLESLIDDLDQLNAQEPKVDGEDSSKEESEKAEADEGSQE